MGKKIKPMAAIIILVILFITGCGSEQLGDEYNEGSDYQYMFYTKMNMGLTMTYGENGYYFLIGHYIYFMDDETHSLVALCNKADCMHNEETDSGRYADCNAYVEDENADCIAYCNGYVYVLDSSGTGYTLYRIKADGSGRDTVKSWSYDDGALSHGMVHRDMFYYVLQQYYVNEDGEFAEKYSVMQLPLTGNNQEESAIYEQPEDVYPFSFSSIQAYGNYVYFTVIGNTTDDSELYLGDEYWKYSYDQMFVYNTQDGSLGEITPPEAEDATGCSPYFSGVTFWSGKILISPSDTGIELGDYRKLYIADLDGSNMEVFLEDAVYGDYYYSDGKYLYVSNYALVARGLEEEEYFQVYDSDMNLVDTFTIPFDGTWNVGIGREEGIYFWTYGENDLDEDGETILSMSLNLFDKGSIGSLDGGAFEYSEVAKWEASPADLD